MTFDYLNTLLDFHYWARDRMLAAVAGLTDEQYRHPLGNSFSSVRETLNHMLFAEWVWHRRWLGESPAEGPDQPDDLDDLKTRWAEQERLVRAFLAGCGPDGVGQVIEYRSLAGVQAASAVWQMVAHVVNHASYHRGQITTMLRQLGAPPPPSTDMILFFREQAA
ncbi:MAG: DinB family protein [Gemmatimonadales bacterium]